MPKPTATSVAVDPVAEEITRLRARLAGGLDQLRTANTGVVDEAEKLARTARGSRPAMRAVTGSHVAASPAGFAPTAAPSVRRDADLDGGGDLTSRFRALR
jgi:hypothetical protein